MNILSKAANLLRTQLGYVVDPVLRTTERTLVLQASLNAEQNSRRDRVNKLSDVEFSVFSQWGEDGILAWLTDNCAGIPKTFVEFGVGDYLESNTRFLLEARNWRGVVLDGSKDHIAKIRSQPFYWRQQLTANQAFIDTQNINDLISAAGLEGEIGLLSIDVDGNDYWIWQAISVVSPAIVAVEYNAVFGDRQAISVPYRADFLRSRAHHSHLFFGASILALINLGGEIGYRFVGTTSTGCNAFFVRNDVFNSISAKIERKVAYPSAVRESRDAQGNLTFVSGTKRLTEIETMSVRLVETGDEVSLASLAPDIYSPRWAAGDWVEL